MTASAKTFSIHSGAELLSTFPASADHLLVSSLSPTDNKFFVAFHNDPAASHPVEGQPDDTTTTTEPDPTPVSDDVTEQQGLLVPDDVSARLPHQPAGLSVAAIEGAVTVRAPVFVGRVRTSRTTPQRWTTPRRAPGSARNAGS